MANNTSLTIKDPESLIIQISPITINGSVSGQLIGGAGLVASAGVNVSSINSSDTLRLRGVFATDGDFARLDPTGEEEDTYIETADGSACVVTSSRKNEKLTIRISGCHEYVERLILMKKSKRPLYLQLTDISNGFNLTSGCAYMLSNPSRTFGVEDNTQEIVFLLTDISDNRSTLTNSTIAFNAAVSTLI